MPGTPHDDPFEKILRIWRTIRDRPDEDIQKHYFLEDLTAPPPHRPSEPIPSWWEACRLLATDGAKEPDSAVIGKMWEEVTLLRQEGGAPGGNDLWQAASVILACAQALREGREDGPCPELATPSFPLRTMRDTVAELRAPGTASDGGGGRRIVQLPAVLVSAREGCLAALELELLDGGSGQFCPALEMALVARDGGFTSELEEARTLLADWTLWPEGWDVRWKLTFIDEKRRSLEGRSLGAAMAFGTAWLAVLHDLVLRDLVPPSPLAERLRAVTHPQRLCFSGAVSRKGELHGVTVEGVVEKIQAAKRDQEVTILIFPKSAIKGVEIKYLKERSMHSPTTFLIKRSQPNAPGLTVICEEHLFQKI